MGGMMEGTGLGAANLCWDVLQFNVAHCTGRLMYLGGPNVKRYARKVRHAKRGACARARPIPANFGAILPKYSVFGDWKHVV